LTTFCVWLLSSVQQVVTGINAEGSVMIPVNETSIIYLKLFRKTPEPPEVAPHQVPPHCNVHC